MLTSVDVQKGKPDREPVEAGTGLMWTTERTERVSPDVNFISSERKRQKRGNGGTNRRVS